MTSLSVILSAATMPHDSIGLCSKSDQYAPSITVTLCSSVGCCLLFSVTLADIGNRKSFVCVADNHMDRPVSESVADANYVDDKQAVGAVLTSVNAASTSVTEHEYHC